VNREWLKIAAAAAVAGAALVGTLVATPTAGAAITASSITSPKDLTFFVADQDKASQTFTVAGTTTGGNPASDKVDIRCYYGTTSVVVAATVSLKSDGSFSASANLNTANVYTPCRLRAVPAGTNPSDVTPFAGHRIGVGYNRTYTETVAPNTGKPYDFYMYAQQLQGGFDYLSVSSCGVDDGYLSDSTLALTTVTFWCNAALFDRELNTNPTRSELQIDGTDAWPTWSAHRINPAATSGYPAFNYSYGVNAHNGNLVIHETEPLVKCTNPTYYPTPATCPKFVSAGVTDTRTISQNHAGLVSWVTDVFSSTDGKKHSLDLLWANNQRFHRNTGDSTQVAYRFPGQTAFATHALNDTVSLPGRAPATIFVNMKGAADGDTATGQGAIVYDRSATQVLFNYVGTGDSQFTLHQTAKVPAGGSTRFRFAYVQGFKAAGVKALATAATHVYTGCVVPKLTGVTLRKAKSSLKARGCSLGKVKFAFSSQVPKGHVISQKPKAGKKLPYGSKVSVVVSKG
jgi:PASTA domain